MTAVEVEEEEEVLAQTPPPMLLLLVVLFMSFRQDLVKLRPPTPPLGIQEVEEAVELVWVVVEDACTPLLPPTPPAITPPAVCLRSVSFNKADIDVVEEDEEYPPPKRLPAVLVVFKVTLPPIRDVVIG